MKNLFLFILLSMGISLTAKEYVPEYQIISSAEDKALKKTEAVFVITFNIGGLSPAAKQIIYSYNKTNKKQITDQKGKIELNVKPGKYLFKFFYNSKHLEVTTDSILIKPGYRTEMRVDLHSTDMPTIVEKPVIYVYGKKTETVSIKLDPKGEFLFTYPQYNNGWNFTANVDGTILMNDKKYHYLFWDGKLDFETEKMDLQSGFIVDNNNLVNFFEEKLKLMGLNAQESEDFITYWCPRMNANQKNYVHFIFNETYNKYASINVEPKPDHMFRVCMLWSKANDNTIVKEQKLESFNRSGFTIVEWGGTEINAPNIIN